MPTFNLTFHPVRTSFIYQHQQQYREVDLLIDPLKASNSQKQRVCTVVTHELAHQWFGNLVTMNWWDDLVRAIYTRAAAFANSTIQIIRNIYFALHLSQSVKILTIYCSHTHTVAERRLCLLG